MKLIHILFVISCFCVAVYMYSVPMKRANIINVPLPLIFQDTGFSYTVPQSSLFSDLVLSEGKTQEQIQTLFTRLHTETQFGGTGARLPFYYQEAEKKAGKVPLLCDEYAVLFMTLCSRYGIKTRCIHLNSATPYRGHYAVEVMLETGEWAFFDPVYGVWFEQDGTKLSLLNVKRSLFYKKELTIRQISNMQLPAYYRELFSYIQVVYIDFQYPVMAPFSKSVVFYNYSGAEGHVLFPFKRLFLFMPVLLFMIIAVNVLVKCIKARNPFDEGFLLRGAAVLVTGFAVRVVWGMYLPQKVCFSDESRYITETIRLIYGLGPTLSDSFLIRDMPLLSFVMALPAVFFGINFEIARMYQAGIAVLHITGVMWCIWLCTGTKKSVLVAGVVSSLYPFFVFFSPLYLTENLYLTMVTLSVACIIAAYRYGGWFYAAAGIFSGLAILTRSIFMIFPLAAAALLLYEQRTFRQVAVYIICTYMLMVPWVARNYMRMGHFIPATNMGGQTLYFGNNPRNVTGSGKAGVDYDIPLEAHDVDEYQRDKIMGKLAKQYIFSNPGITLKNSVKKFFRMWNVFLNAQEYKKPVYSLVSVFSYGVALLLTVLMVIKDRLRSFHIRVFVLFFAYISFFHSLFIASVRYRLAAETFLIICAVMYAERIWDTFQAGRKQCA